MKLLRYGAPGEERRGALDGEGRLRDVQDLQRWLDLKGERMQTGSTETMIFDCATIGSHVGDSMSLEPVDVISTGRPPGTGVGQKPEPVRLRPGDVVRLGIERLGEQQRTFRAWEERA